jgi:flagellar assembly protein FliH
VTPEQVVEQVYTWPNVRGQEKRLGGRSADEIERNARETGFAQGHAEGLEKGLVEGRRQAEAEMAGVRAALDALRVSLERRSRGMDEQQSGDLAAFLLDSFAALVGASARITPEVFTGLLCEARRTPEDDQTVRIEAHPELAMALNGRVGFTIEANGALAPGEIVTHTATGRWSASLQNEFRQLLEQALGGGP